VAGGPPRRVTTTRALESSVGQAGTGSLVWVEGQGRRRRRREAARSGPEVGRGLPTKLTPAFRRWVRFHPARGAAGPLGRDAFAFGRRRMRGPSGPGGSEAPRLGRHGRWRGESPGEHRPAARGNSRRRERTRGGKKASKWVKLAVGGDPVAGDPGRAGSEVFGPRGKQVHSSWGIQAAAPRAWVSVKPRAIRSRRRVFRRDRWMTTREPVASRGVHDLREGNALKGEAQERLRHETRPWNSIVQKPLGG